MNGWSYTQTTRVVMGKNRIQTNIYSAPKRSALTYPLASLSNLAGPGLREAQAQ